jgi:hypothetical protein
VLNERELRERLGGFAIWESLAAAELFEAAQLIPSTLHPVIRRWLNAGDQIKAELTAKYPARTENEKGVPVIPGLEDSAAMAFDDLWQEARRWPLDDACSKLDALYQLGKHHPALAPEMALLRQLDQIHSKLCANLISKRLAKL